jgi:hypothetical protein
MRPTVRLLPLLALVAGCASTAPTEREDTVDARPRTALRSPDGRHTVAVAHGAVWLDGHRLRPPGHPVQVLTAPTWRSDGNAVAWTERGDGETRLVVVSQLGHGAEPMVWPLPRLAEQDRVHWSAPTKVVGGPSLLEPRAVANWTEQSVR